LKLTSIVVNDVTEWLAALGLERYADAFTGNDIDFDLLASLDHEVLQAIGVKSAGHRMTILKAAAALGDEATETTGQDTRESADDLQSAGNEAEHRQLTVMFCDLADSTELSGRLDAETYRDLILAYQQTCTRCVERYEGYVARFFGDGMLVYFGYPRAHEDETQRALYAGLDILEELENLNSGSRNQGVDLAARIGIATGPVVVGDIIGEGASQESAVIGETPNVAARLQALAEPKQVMVSSETKNLAIGEFDYRSLGEQSLKGVEQPVAAWRVLGKRDHGSRFDAARGQQVTPLVGREEERDILVRRWRRTLDGSGQVVMVSGEAGIGKSRLSRELRERIRDQQHIELNYQCSPFHVSSALYPVINQLERAAGFAADDDNETRLDKLERLLAQSSDEIEAAARLLADLLSLPGKHRYGEIDVTPLQQKDRTLQLLVRQLEGLGKHQPVLMVFEDLHWADPTTLELLELTVERIPEIPVMLLATHRPEFAPAWTGESQVYSISLNKLDATNCSNLVKGVSGGISLPPEVLAEIIAKTDGVPLFVEELTKTVMESGMLRVENDNYVLDQPLTSLAIPSTLQDSLMARLDRLAAVKDIAQIGSVIGREFDYELILAVAGLEDSVLTEGLQKLAEAGLVLRRGTPPLASYFFKHALIQDISYASLLKSRRQQLHAKIGTVLVERFPELVETQPELAAQHFYEAGLVAEAIDYWSRAAKLASSRAAPEEAYNHLGFALDALEQLPETRESRHLRLDLLGQRVTPVIAIRGYASPEVGDLVADAMSVYAELGETSPQIFPVLYARWAFALAGGRTIDAPGLADELLAEARRQEDELRVTLGYRLCGCSSIIVGEPRRGLDFLDRALSGLGDMRSNEIGFTFGQDTLAVCLTYSAFAQAALGNYAEVYRFAGLAMARCERIRNPLTISYVHGHFCVLFSELRDFRRLSGSMDQLDGVLREHPMPNWIPVLEYSRAVSDSWESNSNTAVAAIRHSMDVLGGMGFLLWRPIFEANLARIYLGGGEAELAQKSIERGRLLIEQGSDTWGGPELARLQAESILASAAPVDAVDRAYLEALQMARDYPNKFYELRTVCGLARHYKNTGRIGEASELLRTTCETVVEPCEIHDFIAAKQLLSQHDT
jgi:class 3 adenylate cyclase/tetratricopeptide (TPR) repeat protein